MAKVKVRVLPLALTAESSPSAFQGRVESWAASAAGAPAHAASAREIIMGFMTPI